MDWKLNAHSSNGLPHSLVITTFHARITYAMNSATVFGMVDVTSKFILIRAVSFAAVSGMVANVAVRSFRRVQLLHYAIVCSVAFNMSTTRQHLGFYFGTTVINAAVKLRFIIMHAMNFTAMLGIVVKVSVLLVAWMGLLHPSIVCPMASE